MDAELNRLEAEIRSSVQREDFGGAGKLFEQYRDAIEQSLRASSHPQAMCRSLSARVQALFEWARRMTLVSRAKYQTRLGALRDAQRYLATQQTGAAQPTLRLRG